VGRGLLRPIAAGAILVLLATSCIGSAPSTPTTAATAAVTAPNDLRLATADLGDLALDPILSVGGQNNVYMNLIFTPLVGVDREQAKLSKQTGLAEDWQVSPDCTKFSFKLRRGVAFHNGQGEATAEDVKFSLERFKNPEALEDIGVRIIKAVDAITISDPYTLELRFKAPYCTLLTNLSPLDGSAGLVVPKKYIEANGIEKFRSAPVGTGPYKFVERKSGTFIKLEAASDSHFAISGKPAFKTVTLSVVPEQSTREALLKSGEADLIDTDQSGAKQLGAAGFGVFIKPGVDEVYLFFMLQRDGEVTRDLNLRMALSLSINRAEVARTILLGYGSPAGDIFVGQPGIDTVAPDPYDIAKAKEYLSKTPYGEGGKKLTLQLQSAPRSGWPMLSLAELMQQSWKAIGVETVITYRDFASFRQDWSAAAFPAPTVALNTQGYKAHWLRIALSNYRCNVQRNQYCDKDFDKLVDRWAAVSSEQADQQLANEAHKWLTTNRVILPIVTAGKPIVGNSKIPKSYNPGLKASDFNLVDVVWAR
jgi:peptide/nickel transport system substrate-binding protein